MKRLAVCFCLLLLLTPKARAAQGKYAALTFDDGPSGKFTRQLLDGLYDRGAKATFLLCGYRLKEYPDMAQRIFDEGHEIGFHGYSHRDMAQMSRRDMVDELQRTQELLPEGCNPKFLRPPGGNISAAVRQVAEARGLALLSWSVDPKDWDTEDVMAIEQSVLTHVQDGDIILLHDMRPSSVKAALDIVDTLQEEGFELVTVSELIRIRGVNPQAGKIYKAFPPESP